MERNHRNDKLEVKEPIRLHLELKGEYFGPQERIVLKRYGESKTGDSISRDILIPADMPLHNLHYAIQKLFGWQNSHLRMFELPEPVFQQITGGTVKGWSQQVGVLFQPPSEVQEDLFWDDDFNGVRFSDWLRKKYTGPYYFRGQMEDPEVAQRDVAEFIASFPLLQVTESFQDYYERTKDIPEDDVPIKILREAPLSELSLEEMDNSIQLENFPSSLLERLLVDNLLAAQGEALPGDGLFPLCHELTYCYDFGDDWTISITRPGDCQDLLDDFLLSEEELEQAKETLKKTHRPVCLSREGVNVMDDAGGFAGFAELLAALYESEDREERSNLKAWAKGQGWSDKKESLKSLL